MKILDFLFYFCGWFLPSWIRIRNLNADPDSDPATQINADPDPKPWYRYNTKWFKNASPISFHHIFYIFHLNQDFKAKLRCVSCFPRRFSVKDSVYFSCRWGEGGGMPIALSNFFYSDNIRLRRSLSLSKKSSVVTDAKLSCSIP